MSAAPHARPLHVVVLAAGRGTRMASARPKVLHALAGRPLLAHVLDAATALGAARVTVVVGHGADAVEQAFAGHAVHFVRQEPQRGTGEAVRIALDAQPATTADETVLVLYGDVPLTQPSTLAALVAHAHDALALLTVEIADPTGYGRIVRDAGGAVRAIVEHKDADAATRAIREINTGLLAAPRPWLHAALARLEPDNAQREYYLTDVVRQAADDGLSIRASQPAHAWEVTGVNSRAQLAALERTLQHTIAQALLDAGVSLADPARIDVRGTLACAQDVSIDVGCVFEGSVEIEADVTIGPYCVLKDCRIARGTRIAAYTHVDGATIGADNRVGPFARLRPGTVLGADVHVGNFVEIKAAQFDAGSKANHLAYVGDATVGARVNIGAGTITCNYDGAHKHRTVIEDDAFIGSDSQLVAPVRVGRGATLGAGTTLTKDAPPDALTVSRAKQITVTGWKRPTKEK
ncbi:MAG: bifunctional UDP-N-acetylglucosamine diphosphorylase/glucosamine-1-phosphate N-acetyltransferase GlmU [Burkholderiales bacterium]|nr:bifunctional UDP-N-acetylglucosamine diphosphorylase/glucosamine-1-phosphate N-acetyltransferase GlmU [Burkholderiales bacterium]